jgi:hypothetical protein
MVATYKKSSEQSQGNLSFFRGRSLAWQGGLQGPPGRHQVKALHEGRKADVVGIKIASWNVGSLPKKSGEVVEVLRKRRVDVCCIQEARWKGMGTRLIGRHDAKYKIYWKGGKESTAGVAILVAEWLVNKVVQVTRVSERMMMVKMVIGKSLVSVVSAYAPQAALSGDMVVEDEKDTFWDRLQDVVARVPPGEFIMLGGDLNGHVGSGSDGYEGLHGAFGFGKRNKEGDRILEFCQALDLV